MLERISIGLRFFCKGEGGGVYNRRRFFRFSDAPQLFGTAGDFLLYRSKRIGINNSRIIIIPDIVRRLQNMADATVEGVDRCFFCSRSQCSPGKIGLEQHLYFFASSTSTIALPFLIRYPNGVWLITHTNLSRSVMPHFSLKPMFVRE